MATGMSDRAAPIYFTKAELRMIERGIQPQTATWFQGSSAQSRIDRALKILAKISAALHSSAAAPSSPEGGTP